MENQLGDGEGEEVHAGQQAQAARGQAELGGERRRGLGVGNIARRISQSRIELLFRFLWREFRPSKALSLFVLKLLRSTCAIVKVFGYDFCLALGNPSTFSRVN